MGFTGLVRIGDQFAFPRERQIGPAEQAAPNLAGRWMLQTNCGTRSNLATDELIPVREIQQLPPPLFDASEKIIGHAGSSPILSTRLAAERSSSAYLPWE